MAFLHPDDYKLSEAWQLHQSQIGLASGGLFGSGPGYSRAKWGYLGPEAHTDFILAVIGEELGLFGTLVVIGCVVTIMWGGSRISLGAKDQFGRLVAVARHACRAMRADDRDRRVAGAQVDAHGGPPRWLGAVRGRGRPLRPGQRARPPHGAPAKTRDRSPTRCPKRR